MSSASAPTVSRTTVFRGALINPIDLNTYQALPNALLCVDPYGEIVWLEKDVQDAMVQDVMGRNGLLDDGVEVVQLKKGEFLMPGFIDTHTHAPQVPNMGSGQQYELLDWLAEVTFPMESRFSDIDFAGRTYQNVVRRIIDSGTTTCCYYGSLHVEATKALADIVHACGQRAFVGKCNMDRNSPDHYIEPSAESSISGTRDLISHIRSLPALPSPTTSTSTSSTSTDTTHLVHPILTPRFAITCTSDLLTGLSHLASADPTLRIQTHISENLSEVTFTRSLFPQCTSYADVYNKHGLLRQNTILAHAVHLEEAEMETVREMGVGISHCPTSNFNLRSGVCKVGELLDRGIKVGLGTDVSGGFSPSVLTAIQHASIASKIVTLQTSSTTTQHHASWHHIPFANRQLSIPTLLHLATLGGAQVCNLASRVGSFGPGKAFDALLVSVSGQMGNPAVWGVEIDEELGIERGGGTAGTTGRDEKEHLERMLETFMFCGDDRNILRVYVQGRVVGGKEWTGSKP